MLRAKWLGLLLAPAVAVWGCGETDPTDPPPTDPILAALAPTSAMAGSPDLRLTISGTNISLTNVSTPNTTTMTATINLGLGTELGAHYLTVTTPNGTIGGLSFTVFPAGSFPGTITPSVGIIGTSVPVTIIGTGFVPGVSWSDHWAFWEEGYPALMVTDTAPFRYEHYHLATDTPDKLDFDRMARVVRGLEHVVAELAR